MRERGGECHAAEVLQTQTRDVAVQGHLVFDINYFGDPLMKKWVALSERARNKDSCYTMFTILNATLKFCIHCFSDLQQDTILNPRRESPNKSCWLRVPCLHQKLSGQRQFLSSNALPS